MFFELREYHIRRGMGERWAKLMDEMIIPFQRDRGMEVPGSFRVQEQPDIYVWIRRFESEDERQRLYDRVYGSNYWKTTVRQAMGEMLLREEIRVMTLTPTACSTLR